MSHSVCELAISLIFPIKPATLIALTDAIPCCDDCRLSCIVLRSPWLRPNQQRTRELLPLGFPTLKTPCALPWYRRLRLRLIASEPCRRFLISLAMPRLKAQSLCSFLKHLSPVILVGSILAPSSAGARKKGVKISSATLKAL